MPPAGAITNLRPPAWNFVSSKGAPSSSAAELEGVAFSTSSSELVPMNLSAPKPSPLILGSSAGGARHMLEAALVHVPRGVSRAPASERHRIGIHFGPPVNAECSVGGLRMRRLQKHGDIDFVPAGVDGVWEDDADCRILRLGFHASLL